jgi:nitroreductase
MEIDEAIKGRRSIRKYANQSVSMELIHKVLEAAIWAPSAKKGQQWRFTILTGDSKKKLTMLFRQKLQLLSAKVGIKNMGSSFSSCSIMEEAPVIIIVWNANDNKLLERSSLQSVAAAIQNMLLKAYSLGLGSLWICDIYYAEDAVVKHFNKPWTLVAAVTLGWSASNSKPLPRRKTEEVSEFLS